MAATFAAIERSATADHIVVHFHGGLVPGQSAEESATTLLPVYEAGGAYPIFFIWHSDLWGPIKRNLDAFGQEKAFRRLVKRILQLVSGKLMETSDSRGGTLALESLRNMPDGLEALAEWAKNNDARGPVSELTDSQQEQVTRELKADKVLQKEAQRIAASLGAMSDLERKRSSSTLADLPSAGTRYTGMSREVRDEILAEANGDGSKQARGIPGRRTLVKYGTRIAIAVVRRYAKHRDHGLYTTVIEEILRTLYLDDAGSAVWGQMKKDTKDAFGNDATQYGGTAFLEHLKTWWKPGRRVTLVGHSAGAVFIGHLLDAADDVLPEACTFDVVLLAPACTFAFVAERLPRLLRRVRARRLFALSDAIERGYFEIPVLYQGSLLYLISGLLESPDIDVPLVGMQRYHSGAKPYTMPDIAPVMEFFGGRCSWSECNDPIGARTTAQKHGGLANDGPTQESLRHFLMDPPLPARTA